MAEFKAFSPHSEVRGQGILVLINGMGSFYPTALKILAAEGLTDIQADQWYPMQPYLNAYRQIRESIGPLRLRVIGRKVPEIALWPAHIKSVEAGLAAIDAAYHMNYRNGDEGFYKFEKTGRQAGKMLCYNPFACSFDLGLIEATARKFSIKKAFVRVTHDETQECRREGGDSCTYLIVW